MLRTFGVRVITGLALFIALLLGAGTPAASDKAAPVAVTVFDSFEAPDALAPWLLRSVAGEVTDEHATEGRHAARLVYPQWHEGAEKWPAFILDRGRGPFRDGDWRPYDVLAFDVYNDSPAPARLKLRIDDAHGRVWQGISWELPPRKPFRAELELARLAGPLDLSEVSHFDLYMSMPDRSYTLFLDNIRLVALPLRVTEATLRPDPFRSGHVAVTCKLSRPGRCHVRIVGPDGKTARAYRRACSQLSWTWDARTSQGLAPPGSYRAELRVEDPAWKNFRAYRALLGTFTIEPKQRRPAMVAWTEPTTRKVMLFSRPAPGEPVACWLPAAEGLRPSAPATGPVLRVDMARNEFEGVQVVFLTRDRQVRLRCAIEGLKHAGTGETFPTDNCTVYQVGYVLTKDPKIYQVDYVGWWPDPLLPQTDLFAEPGEAMPVWVSLKSERNTRPGLYRGQLAVWVDGKRAGSLPLEVRVYEATLPDTTTIRTAFSMYEHMIARIYGGELSPAMKRKYQQFVADHRINPDNIYRSSPPPIEDVEYFARQGKLNAFNIVHINGTQKWDDARLASLAAKLDPYVAELKRRGLEKLGYIYGFDEAGPSRFAAMKKAFAFLKKRYPGIPIVTTARDRSYGLDTGLDDVVDVWVPLTAAYNFEAAEAARRRGKQVWWYICIGPRHPYANWFVEYTAIEPRLLGWMTYQQRVTGFLYYTMTRWPNQHEPMRLDGHNKTNWNPASYRTANGDGCLFYGGPDGPITTVRFENVRDGFEDYELLCLLAKRLGDEGAAGRTLCDNLIPTLTTWTRDVQQFARVRRELLRRASVRP